MNWQFKVLFSNNRERLIQLIISELIFLDDCLKRVENKKDIANIKIIYKKIEKILIAQQKNIDKVLSEKDFVKCTSRIYHLLNILVERIN